uniref:[histone H3]-dimethyl-L-lysine(36) demethylase n=1 Tax=Bathyctena chuni TaxID=1403704 RepID=V9PPI9_BATCU|nr:T-box domain-containing protein [Bathyctena chuni]
MAVTENRSHLASPSTPATNQRIRIINTKTAHDDLLVIRVLPQSNKVVTVVGDKRRCAEKFYDEDLGLNINLHNITTFDLSDKVHSDTFDKDDGSISYINSEDITLQNMMRTGFRKPFIVRAESGKPPGLRVPDSNFTVKDVERLVSSTRKIDVMDVSTQLSLQMTMHQWAKYFDSDKRDTLLNVISLEISQTPLCKLISPPDFVRELDWVETAWPPSLKVAQTFGNNSLTKMKYPKVQKYCLMSVRGSYTDFHVDFGGTSVWYHIVAGAKVFWLIPPTEENLSKFVKWTLAGKQDDIFFGDLVDKCYRVNLYVGDTFFLPGGWIHAVYTPRKSLVFGGKFLHSYNIIGQLQVTAIEDVTKVEARYLYPYFVQMVWFVVEKYRRHLKHIEVHGKGNTVLLEQEVEGLNVLISRLEESKTFQSAIPIQIRNPKLLLQELKDLLLHAEIDTICGDFSEPIISRERNTLLDSARKLHNIRLISTDRPFKMSPVVSSDSDVSEDEDVLLLPIIEEKEEEEKSTITELVEVIVSDKFTNPSSSRKETPLNEDNNVTVEISNKELWQAFCKHGTEMIIIKAGRRLFPVLKFKVSGLDPNSKYVFLVDIVPADDCWYRFCNCEWIVAGEGDHIPPKRMYVHPESPNTGAHWMKEILSFHKLKIAHNVSDAGSNMIVNSMHRYQPRVHIVQCDDIYKIPWCAFRTMVFTETEFFAVTAYQSEKITQLKIEHNPFAKGFRAGTATQAAEERYNSKNINVTIVLDSYGTAPFLAAGGAIHTSGDHIQHTQHNTTKSNLLTHMQMVEQFQGS